MTDRKEADIICLGQDGKGCGMVVQDHKPHEGENVVELVVRMKGNGDNSITAAITVLGSMRVSFPHSQTLLFIFS